MKQRYLTIIVFSIAVSGAISLCSSKLQEKQSLSADNIIKVKPVVIKKIPHDPEAFTQGLIFHDGKLVESTGIYGKSTIRIVDTNGTIERLQKVNQVFAEGCALFRDLLYQITWQDGICIVYKYPSLEVSKTFNYDGEGWGLTNDGIKFYMSDGSNVITVRNAQFEIDRKITVTLNEKPLTNINELEFVRDKIYANVWFSNYIFVVNVSSGVVERIIDCERIVAIENPENKQHVLNGIAFNEENGLFYITGKKWKNMFVVAISD